MSVLTPRDPARDLRPCPGRPGEMAHREEDFEHLMTVAEKEHPEVTVRRCVVAGTAGTVIAR